MRRQSQEVEDHQNSIPCNKNPIFENGEPIFGGPTRTRVSSSSSSSNINSLHLPSIESEIISANKKNETSLCDHSNDSRRGGRSSSSLSSQSSSESSFQNSSPHDSLYKVVAPYPDNRTDSNHSFVLSSRIFDEWPSDPHSAVTGRVGEKKLRIDEFKENRFKSIQKSGMSEQPSNNITQRIHALRQPITARNTVEVATEQHRFSRICSQRERMRHLTPDPLKTDSTKTSRKSVPSQVDCSGRHIFIQIATTSSSAHSSVSCQSPTRSDNTNRFFEASSPTSQNSRGGCKFTNPKSRNSRCSNVQHEQIDQGLSPDRSDKSAFNSSSANSTWQPSRRNSYKTKATQIIKNEVPPIYLRQSQSNAPNESDVVSNHMVESNRSDSRPGSVSEPSSSLINVDSQKEGLTSPARSRKLIRSSSPSSSPPPSLSQLSQELTYDELVLATDNFHPSRKLGKGACGSVYWGVLPSGTEIAVKVLRAFEENGFEEEVRVLSRCRHPNLVTLIGWAKYGSRRFIVYEFLPGGDVCQTLLDVKIESNSDRVFAWRQRLFVALETTQAVAYLHGCRPKVFHRDIKSANILLNQHGTAKLADFGLACVADSNNHDSHYVKKAEGTPGYADPKYVETLEVNEPREVYSLGMLYLELLTSQPPAAYVTLSGGSRELKYLVEEVDVSDIDTILPVVDKSLEFPTGVARAWGSLALRCIADVEDHRPTAAEAVRTLKEIWKTHHECDKSSQGMLQHRSTPPAAPESVGRQTKSGVARTSAPEPRSNPRSIIIVNGETNRTGNNRRLSPRVDLFKCKTSPRRNVPMPQELRERVAQQQSPRKPLGSPQYRRFANSPIRHDMYLSQNDVPPAYQQSKSLEQHRHLDINTARRKSTDFPPEHFAKKYQLNEGLLKEKKWREMESFEYPNIRAKTSRPYFNSRPDRLFDFDLVGDILAADSNPGLFDHIDGGTYQEVWDNIQITRPYIFDYVRKWLSTISVTSQHPTHSFQNSHNTKRTSIMLHQIVFGRRRVNFSDQLKEKLPGEWFTCISRQHFSISVILVGCFKQEKKGAANSSNIKFEIEFELNCLSANGAGLNKHPLLSSDRQKLVSGDLIHIFNPSCARDGSTPMSDRSSASSNQSKHLENCIVGLIFRPNGSSVQKLKGSILSNLTSELQTIHR